ncbi:hypothetical protein ADUPG1_010838, partial [Aduncisulcus paluster]
MDEYEPGPWRPKSKKYYKEGEKRYDRDEKCDVYSRDGEDFWEKDGKMYWKVDGQKHWKEGDAHCWDWKKEEHCQEGGTHRWWKKGHDHDHKNCKGEEDRDWFDFGEWNNEKRWNHRTRYQCKPPHFHGSCESAKECRGPQIKHCSDCVVIDDCCYELEEKPEWHCGKKRHRKKQKKDKRRQKEKKRRNSHHSCDDDDSECSCEDSHDSRNEWSEDWENSSRSNWGSESDDRYSDRRERRPYVNKKDIIDDVNGWLSQIADDILEGTDGACDINELLYNFSLPLVISCAPEIINNIPSYINLGPIVQYLQTVDNDSDEFETFLAILSIIHAYRCNELGNCDATELCYDGDWLADIDFELPFISLPDCVDLQLLECPNEGLEPVCEICEVAPECPEIIVECPDLDPIVLAETCQQLCDAKLALCPTELVCSSSDFEECPECPVYEQDSCSGGCTSEEEDCSESEECPSYPPCGLKVCPDPRAYCKVPKQHRKSHELQLKKERKARRVLIKKRSRGESSSSEDLPWRRQWKSEEEEEQRRKSKKSNKDKKSKNNSKQDQRKDKKDSRKKDSRREKSQEERSRSERSEEERSRSERSREERSRSERSREERSRSERSREERSRSERSREERSRSERSEREYSTRKRRPRRSFTGFDQEADVRGKDILDDIRLFILDALYGLIGMRPDHQFLACRCPLYPPCPYCPPAERFCPDEPICPDPVCGDCPCPLMPDCPVGRCQDICPEPPIQPEC